MSAQQQQSGNKGGSRAAKKRRMKNQKGATDSVVDTPVVDEVQDEIDEEEKHCIENIHDRSLMDILDADDLSSKMRSQAALQYLLSPTSVSEFESQFFENQPLLCNRSTPGYFNGLFSKMAFEQVINRNVLSIGGDIQITRNQSNGLMILKPSTGSKDDFAWKNENEVDEEEEVEETKEVTNNSSMIWQRYKSGCVLQLLCPEKYCDSLWKFVSYLEGFMNAKIYCQSFLVPASSTCYGLRSHPTDRYIVQMEGISSVEVYKPSSIDGLLPRVSNTTVSATDYLSSGSISAVLSPGDSIYIPKGWVHSLEGCSGKASVTVHLLTNEHNSIADLIDIALPQALSHTIAESIDLRRAVPRNIGEFMGVSAAVQEDDLSDEEELEEDDQGNPVATTASTAEKKRKTALLHVRQQFKKRVAQLLHRVVDDAVDMLDASVDQIAKGLVGARLPPALTEAEEERTKFGSQARRIGPFTRLCVVRENAARLCVEDGVVVVYHCLDNGREVYSNPLSPLEYDLDDGPAIEKLLSTLYVPVVDEEEEEDGEDGPKSERAECGVMVTDLPHTSEELHDKVSIAESLYKEGLLMVVDEDGPGDTHRLAGAAAATKKTKSKSVSAIAVAERLLEEYSAEAEQRNDISTSAGTSAASVGEQPKVEKKGKKEKKRSAGGDKGMEKFLAGVSKRAEESQKKIKISEDDEDCPF